MNRVTPATYGCHVDLPQQLSARSFEIADPVLSIPSRPHHVLQAKLSGREAECLPWRQTPFQFSRLFIVRGSERRIECAPAPVRVRVSRGCGYLVNRGPSFHACSPGPGKGFTMVYSPQLGVPSKPELVLLTWDRVLPKTSDGRSIRYFYPQCGLILSVFLVSEFLVTPCCVAFSQDERQLRT